MSAHSSGLTSGAKDKVQSSHPQWQPLEEQVSHECRMRNDRQSYFKVVRELVRAQFELGMESSPQGFGKTSPTGISTEAASSICSMAAATSITTMR